MRDWLPRFRTLVGSAHIEDLVSFGDCFYLPHEDGQEAIALFNEASVLVCSRELSGTDFQARARAFCKSAAQLRDFCARCAALEDRALFHALSRRLWDLREELDLLVSYLEWKATSPDAPFRPNFHLPGTYRGGLVARLQQLLAQDADGGFSPSPLPGIGRF